MGITNKYKREFMRKVKQKINDVQAGSTGSSNDTAKPCDDKGRKVCNGKGVDKKG